MFDERFFSFSWSSEVTIFSDNCSWSSEGSEATILHREKSGLMQHDDSVGLNIFTSNFSLLNKMRTSRGLLQGNIFVGQDAFKRT